MINHADIDTVSIIVNPLPYYMLEGYLGNPGAGKTYCMVRRALPYIGKIPIYANMELDWAINFEDWEQLVGITNALVLIDEVSLWFDAAAHADMPHEIKRLLRMSRKQGLHIWYTSQHEASVNVNFRRLTAVYYRHERYGQFIVQKSEDAPSGKKYYTQIIPLQKKVYARYDTFEAIGNNDGTGKGRGAAGLQKDKKEAERLMRVGYVRDEQDGTPCLRRPTSADLYTGAIVWERTPAGFVKVDTSRFQLVGSAAPRETLASAPAALPGPTLSKWSTNRYGKGKRTHG